MFEHYLPNKNECATVALNSNFLQLNTALLVHDMTVRVGESQNNNSSYSIVLEARFTVSLLL